MEDTSYTVKATQYTASELVVTVRIEASYDNGETWELDIMGEETVFLIPQGGKNATLTETHSNPTAYTSRRFTIVSIMPNEDSEFKYVAGSPVVISEPAVVKPQIFVMIGNSEILHTTDGGQTWI
jgi:hypothetical protein